MKSKINLWVLFVVTAFFAFTTASFSGVDYKKICSNSNELKLRISFNIDNFQDITTADGQSVINPYISGMIDANDKSGAPALLQYSLPISIPSENGFTLKGFKVLKSEKISGILAPTPELSVKNEFTVNEYKLDEQAYSDYKNDYDNVKVRFIGVSGLSPVALISVTPFNFDYAAKSISFIKEIELTVGFDKNAGITNNKYTNKPPTINASDVPNWVITSMIKQNPKQDEKLMGDTPANNWVKIKIDREGVYSISAAMLSSLGVNIGNDKINTIKIYGYGGHELSEKVTDGLSANLPEQEIIVNKNNDGSLNNIIFYAATTTGFELKNGEITHYLNHYGNTNYYLLSWDGDDGKRASAIEPPEGQVINTPTTYTHRIFGEEELNMPWKSGMGRLWLGRTMFPYTAINRLNNIDRNANIKYRVYVGQALSDNDKSGIFKIYENGTLYKSIVINGNSLSDANRRYAEFTVPGSALASDDISNLKIEYSANNTSSATPFMDWYEIHYPRSFAAVDNELSMISINENNGKTEYTLNNFIGDIYGWDVSNLSAPKLLKNLSHTGSIFIFQKEIKSSELNRIFVSSNLRTPTLEKISLANLRSTANDADLIVITHRDLAESAQKYVDYKNSKSGFKARLVFVDDIFNEFACGIADPSAIRNFIQYLYFNNEHKPGYVLLWGDGHYDYKNISSNTKNYVIPWETPDETDSFSGHTSITTDDFYSYISGDDSVCDIAIGRLPISTDNAGITFLNKVKEYEDNSSKDSWRTNLVLLSDDSPAADKDTNGSTHTLANEELGNNYIPIDMNLKKMYMVNYPVEYQGAGRRKPKVTEDLVSTANVAGTNLISYFGHGNPRVLAHEEVFDRDKTIQLFTNFDKLFFFTGATCDFARFDHPDVQSGSEELVKYPLGGAIGTFAATRSIGIGSSDALVYSFYKNLFVINKNTKKLNTVGDAIIAAKCYNISSDDRSFNLFGDPSMRLAIPEKIVSIDTVNGISIRELNDTMKLKGLSKVVVSGRILDTDSTLMTSFNGIGLIDLWDASEKVSVADIDNSIHTFDKLGNALNKTSVSIVNGTFTGEFYIPKDISYAKGLAKISIYAYDTLNQNYARGAWNHIQVSGLDETAAVEDNGPRIDIYLDSREFRSGDLVCNTPLLIADIADDTGINTTGAGIGHKIEAWIDDNQNIDLTRYFNCSTVNPKAGIIEKVLYDLSAGIHTLKIRAWDVFNNYSVSYVDFKIGTEKDGIIISKAYTVPNPAIGDALIEVIHNAPGAYTVTLEVYNQAGALVKTVSKQASEIYKCTLPIDTYDDNNKLLPQGTYYYSVKIDTGDKSGTGYGSYVIVK